MPNILMPYTVHLDHTLRVTPLNTLFAKGDSAAHRFELTILRAGIQDDLTGCTVFGKFYRMADSTVVSMTGSVENGKAVVVLDAACYDYIGRFALTIAIQKGEEKTTVFYGDGYMHGHNADTAISGEYIIYDINTLLGKIAEIDASTQAANTATSNANTATANANTATGNANTAANAAKTAATNANTAKGAANAAAEKINSMTVSATPVSTGTATASLSTVDGHYHLALGLPNGDTGATPQISVQVQTGAAGSEAQVSVTGTAENPVIHLTIPRGDVGDIGNLTINGKAPDGSGAVTLTAADVGALAAGGTATDSSKLGGKAPEYYLQPRNLLDNSDFSNLIAQAGLNGAHGSTAYIADRWISPDASATQQNGYTTLSTTGKTGRITQNFSDALAGKTVTAAAKVSGNSIVYCGIYYTQNSVSKSIAVSVSSPNGIIMKSGTIPTDATDIEFRIYIAYTDGGGSCDVYWAALYEDSYTADNLPPYVPKGYAAEIAECQRYYYRLEPSTSSFTYAYGYCYNETQARFNLHIPKAMVIRNPTFLYTAGTYLRVVQNGTSKDITNLSLTATVGNHALIQATSSDLVSSQAAVLMMSGGVFEFIADL